MAEARREGLRHRWEYLVADRRDRLSEAASPVLDLAQGVRYANHRMIHYWELENGDRAGIRQIHIGSMNFHEGL